MATFPISPIVRLPRTDSGADEFILGQVTSDGPRPLDVKVVVTEGEASYTVKLRQNRIDELRDRNSACSASQWERILKFVLLGGVPVEAVEAGAALYENKITVTIRRRVAGINQRLGTIVLGDMDEEDIRLFEWCRDAVGANEKIKADLAIADARSKDLERKVTLLKDQLAELESVKKAEDALLLARFRALLNEKKARIGQQEYSVDSAKTAVPSGRSASSAAQPGGAARGSKRKAVQAAPSDDDSDAGTKKTSAETPENRDEPEDRHTSADEADATASETDGDGKGGPVRGVSANIAKTGSETESGDDDDGL